MTTKKIENHNRDREACGFEPLTERERNSQMMTLVDKAALAPKPPITVGITDITTRVDQRSRAVLAAEEFAACEIRCHMLHGQWIAETDRLVELKRQLDAIVDEITTKTVKMGPL